MAGWDGTRPLPPDWRRRCRLTQRRYGGQCHACGHLGATATDHVVPRAEGGSDDLSNLRPIHGGMCPSCKVRCHDEKTRAEIARGKARVARRRPPPTHPGMVHG